jgi:hypothetical protein
VSDAPLYLGESLGYRAWHLDGDGLRSLNQEQTWEPGENRAHCLRDEGRHGVLRRRAIRHDDEEVPAEGCDCGLFAYHSLDMAEYYGRMFGGSVLGAVSGSSRVSVYRHGFRAQRARVLALLLPPWGLTGDAAERQREGAGEAASAFGVPLFDSNQINEFLAYCESREEVAPLPEQARPGARGWRISRAFGLFAWAAVVLASVLLVIRGLHALSSIGAPPILGVHFSSAGAVALVIGAVALMAFASVKLLRRAEEMHFFNLLERIGEIDRSRPPQRLGSIRRKPG